MADKDDAKLLIGVAAGAFLAVAVTKSIARNLRRKKFEDDVAKITDARITNAKFDEIIRNSGI